MIINKLYYTWRVPGPPDPLFNCSVSNRTSTGVTVWCLEAFDGGLVQRFLLAVFSYDNQVTAVTMVTM